MASDRIAREAEFHDAAFAGDARKAAGKYYLAARAAKAYYHDLILNGCRGRAVLEYGCGLGSAAFELAVRGASVTGIDISEVGIEQARERGQDLGLDEQLDFRPMNAEALEFGDDRFDLVCGSGILHHLDLSQAVAEIERVLKPGGAAVFFEPLGHNPLISLYRRLTPAMRSVDEHPLELRDLQTLAHGFTHAESRFFGLLTLLAVPLRSLPGFGLLLRAFETLDAWLLHGPARRFAWITVIHLQGPRTAACPSRSAAR